MRRSIFYLSIFVLLFSVSCGGSDTKENNTNNNESSNTDNSSNLNKADNDNTASVKLFKVKKSTGEQVGSITLKGGAIDFIVNGVAYKSKLKGEKRKYQNASLEITHEVKFSDAEKFKVRTPDGKLLWKIKLYDDKVKISDNEENENPYQVKKQESGKAKVEKNDTRIGKLTLNSEKKQIEVSSDGKGFVIEAEDFSIAFGVLLADEISDVEQFIIISELLNKGK